MPAIEVRNLTKRFGAFTAVNDVSFDVPQGSIFGFLGANGAGKSTTIRMLCGLLLPTSGKATVAGFDVMTQTADLKRNIGYMSQKFSLYDDLSVEENLNFFGGVYGLTGDRFRSRKEHVLDLAHLTGEEKRLTGALPGGIKQRLALGAAIIHEPAIVFLDEPTGGVDPIMRREFWELINQLSAEGTTILVTTHYLDEAEFCNEIMLIDAGVLIARGTPTELKTEYIRNPIIEVECDDAGKAMVALDRQPWVKELSLFGSYLHVQVIDAKDGDRRLREVLKAHAIDIQRTEQIVPSLEDVFIHLIEGRAANNMHGGVA